MRRQPVSQVKGLVVLCALAGSLSLQGELLVYENFDYASGTAIASGGTLGTAGENGWANSWSFSTYTGEIVGGLNLSGLVSSGNALKVTRNNTGYLYRRFDSLSAGTYYFSMMFLRNDAANGAASENLLLRIQNETGLTTATGWSAALGTTSTEEASVVINGTTAVTGTEVYTWDATNLMLAKMTVDGSGNATLWHSIYSEGDVIPADESGVVWQASTSENVGSGFAAGLQLVMPSGIEAITIDEFRVATTFRDAVNSRQLGLFILR